MNVMFDVIERECIITLAQKIVKKVSKDTNSMTEQEREFIQNCEYCADDWQSDDYASKSPVAAKRWKSMINFMINYACTHEEDI